MPGQAGFDQLTIEEQIRYIKGFDEIVTSSASLIATGWSDPSPGGNLTRWISTPFTAHSSLTLRAAERQGSTLEAINQARTILREKLSAATNVIR